MEELRQAPRVNVHIDLEVLIRVTLMKLAPCLLVELKSTG